MLFYVKHFAQMCNRLWALAPVVAYALNKRKKVYVLFAKKSYVNCFPNLKGCEYLKFLFPHDNQSPKSLEWRIALLSEKYNLEVKGELRNVNHLGFLTFIDGWKHSEDISYIAEHKKEIVEMFKPDEQVVNKVNSYFQGYDGITVGVHVRRGDYKEYLGGRYFYNDGVYEDLMLKLGRQFDVVGKKVRFLICSNESFRVLNDKIHAFTIKDTNGITDLYALSCCDYIIGPPSSFSQWASFYGSVPLLILLNDNQEINLNSFSRIVSFNYFENGKSIKLNEQKKEYYIY